jgi:hypothetical protein
MFFRSPEDVLLAWENSYGKLEGKWRKEFLEHETMKPILKHLDEHIEVAIRRNKRLASILEDLYDQEYRLAEFNRSLHPHITTSEGDSSLIGRHERSAKSKIEGREREGGRWGRSTS